jgi:hypothetical protein
MKNEFLKVRYWLEMIKGEYFINLTIESSLFGLNKYTTSISKEVSDLLFNQRLSDCVKTNILRPEVEYAVYLKMVGKYHIQIKYFRSIINHLCKKEKFDATQMIDVGLSSK